MSKEKLFKELIASMAEDGEISATEYEILLEKGKDLGLNQRAVDLLIRMELNPSANRNFTGLSDNDGEDLSEAGEHIFKSAITRGGGIFTPDIIIIDEKTLTYKKRNKYLINVDSITVPISRISSVKLDTGILGTDIIIKTFGEGEIIGKKFTKADAKEIRRLIRKRQTEE